MKKKTSLLYLLLAMQIALGQNTTGDIDLQPCSNPTSLLCGEPSLFASTIGATSDFFSISYSSCVNYGPDVYDAPDQLYKFNLAQATEVTISIEIFTANADLDLFLLSSCQPANCIAFSTNITNVESIVIQLNPGEYFIVVDGYSGWTGDYNIKLSCNCISTALICGAPPLAETTVGKSSSFFTGSYSPCADNFGTNAYNAPDNLYKITLEKAARINILMEITTANADLDMFLLSGCESPICYASSTNTSTLESIEQELPPGEYYLAVDGYGNSQGDYTLQMSCTDASFSTVCDFGGTLINRSDFFSGTLDVSDLAPYSLNYYPQIINAYNGNLPQPLYADIYVVYGKGSFYLNLDSDISDSTIRRFVFVCEYPLPDTNPPPEIPDECLFGEKYWWTYPPANAVIVTENPCSDFYYIVVTGKLGDSYFNLRTNPEWDCPKPITDSITCGESATAFISTSDGGIFNNFAYERCYNGSRLYNGTEKFYKFVLSRPSKVIFNLSADGPMGMFLYSFMCGQNCLGYAENTAFDNNAILSATLSEGVYYLALDTEDDGSNLNFTVSADCEEYSPFIDEASFISGNFSNCPTNPAITHQVNINYDPTFASSDYFNFYFRDTDGKLKGHTEASQYWHNSTQPMPFYLKGDLAGGEKCSFAPGDSFYVFIHQTENGKRTYKRFSPTYAGGAPAVFQSGANSQILSLAEVNAVNFGAETSFLSVSPNAITLPLAFTTNLKWAVEKVNGPASWLTVSPTQSTGAETISLGFTANTSPLPRSVVLRFYSSDAPDLYRQFVKIEQQGQCIVPQPVNIVPGATTVCLGSSLNLTADVGAPYQDLYNYLWSTGETTPSIDAIPPLPGNNNYSVTVTNKHCFITSDDQHTVFVNDTSSLVTQIVLLSSIKCNGGNDGALSVGGTSTTPPLIYEWSNGATGQSISNLTAGMYTVTVTDGAGCEDVNTYTLNEPPAVAIANVTIVDATNGQNNGSVSVQVTGGTPGYTYQWLSAINNMPIAGQTQSTLTASGPGNYKIQVKDANGCIFVSEAYKIDNISATNNPVLAAQIKSYPNPTSGKLYLQCNFTTQLETEIRLYDLLGREVFAASPGKVLSDLFEFDLSEMASGLYLLKINVESSFIARTISVKK